LFHKPVAVLLSAV